jgi:hypothetical protein
VSVFIDVKSRFDDASGRRAAEEAKGYFERAGTSSGSGFMGNFARAVERDSKVRAAADKVADQLDKITIAETKRATQLERSKAINDAVAASEAKRLELLKTEAADSDAVAKATEDLNRLKLAQTRINNQLVASATAVSRAERDKARAIREAGDAYRQTGTDLDGIRAKFDGLGASLGSGLKLNLGLAGIGLLPAAATAITDVAGAMQQLAGAGFAVPGIFAGIAASVGVGALGMYGMGDAITAVAKASDGTKASVEAANQALADLAPAQAEVVKTAVGMRGTFNDLRALGSGNMFEGVSGGLRDMAGNLLPSVTRGVDGISQGINQNLLQAMNSLGSESSVGFLDRIFGSTADAQSKLTAAIDPAVNAIGTLTAAGSDSLPRLATAVGNVADRFNAFITAADGDGRLDKWIDQGLTGFTQLGNTALNIGKTFTALTEAAGGGTGLLGTLESATGRLQIFLNSTEGQSKLRDYFAQGRDLLTQLKDVATTAGPVLAGVFSAGVSAANVWLPIIRDGLAVINSIPGGAEAVVTAFVAWKTMQGPVMLLANLANVSNALGLLPAKATTAAAGISKALSMIVIPAIGIEIGKQIEAAVDSNPALRDINHSNTPDQWGKNARDWVDRNIFGEGKPAPTAPGIPQEQLNRPAGTRESGGLPNASGLPGDQATRPAGSREAGNLSPRSGSISPDTLARKDDVSGVPDPIIKPTDPVALSGYSDPVITEPVGGSGAEITPFIDPSKYTIGDPLAKLPAPVAGADMEKVFETDSKLITATNGLEQKRLALQVLEAKGNATQQELLTTRNDLQEQERAVHAAEYDALQARTGKIKQAAGDINSVFTSIDEDFGLSKGIPGFVENLVKTFGNLAMGSAIGSSPSLQAGAMALAANGGVAPGLFNQKYFTADGTAVASSSTASPTSMDYFSGATTAMPSASVMPSILKDTGSVPSGPQSRQAAALVQQMFGDQIRGTIGGSRDNNTAKNTHDAGLSIDIPIGPDQKALGDQIRDYLQSNAEALGLEYTIWRDQGVYPGTGGKTGFTTPGHQDHIDAHFDGKGGTGGAVMAPTARAGFASASGATPVFVVNMPGGGDMGTAATALFGGAATPAVSAAADTFWDKIAAKESSGNWANADTGGSGHYGGLQFSPSTWNAFGGQEFAKMPHEATREQQIAVADRTAFTGYNGTKPQGLGAWEVITNGSTAADGITVNSPRPTGGPGWFPPGAGLPTSAPSGEGFGGIAGPKLAPNIGPAPLGGGVGASAGSGLGPTPGVGAAAGTPGMGTGVTPAATPGGQGIGLGGDLMGAAGMAADMVAPGSSLALKVANRTIQFGAQAAAIGVDAVAQTVLPAGSPLAANSWFSKLVGGLSGAKPAKPNMAGGKGGEPQQAPVPPGGAAPAPVGQKGGDTNINVTTAAQTDDGTARAIQFHQQAANAGPGH